MNAQTSDTGAGRKVWWFVGLGASVVLAVVAAVMAFVLVVMMAVTGGTAMGGKGAVNPCLVNYTGGDFANPLVGQITSPFGPRPNPFGPGQAPAGIPLDALINHRGTDIAGVPAGTPYYAAAAGTVVAAYGPNSVDGAGDGANGIIIDIGNNVQMWYWHALEGSAKVKRGDKIAVGQELAGVGMSGAATAVHLHLEIKDNGVFVDPQKWMAAKGITLGTGTAAQAAQLPERNGANQSPAAQDRGQSEMSVPGANGAMIQLSAAQMQNAQTIRDVGVAMGATPQDLKIALMTAMQESNLKVLSNRRAYPASVNVPNQGDGSDNDSVGIFQQRPKANWGTVEQLMDPAYSVRAFFGGPTGPNNGSPRGLFDIPNYASLPLGAAAQAVQVSAFPDAYDKWSALADSVLAQLGGAPPSQCDPAAGKDIQSVGNVVQARQKVLDAARKGLGGTYVWGGEQFQSWDCSGYVKWVYEQAGITLPRTEQWNVGTKTNNPQPGDLVVQRPDGKGGWSHVGIYAGAGQMYSALNPGSGTLQHPVDWNPGSEYFTLIKN